MKNLVVGVLVSLVIACGGSKPATQPSNTEPAPAAEGSGSAAEGSGGEGSAATGTCEAAGGKCIQMQAAVSCASKPTGTCPANEFCCGM